MANVIDSINAASLRDDNPDFRAGDTIKVHVKVVEGNRSRVQVFQGVVIKVQGSGVGRTFTVRKVVGGIGVERVFPLYSPMIDEVELVRRSKVRRAKLYFIREKATKEIRKQMRRVLTAKEAPEAVEAVAEVKAEETPKA